MPTRSRRARTRARAGAPALHPAVADLRALAHPLRLRMMELFAESPKTTKQVADLLGEPPTRLYHHVAALERAGLLVLKDTRQNRGAVEKWYAAVSQQMGTSAKNAGSRASRRALAATVLEQAKHEVTSMPPRSKEAPFLMRLIVAMPRRRIADVRKRLYEAVKSMREEFGPDDDATPAADCERWAVTLAFAPVATPMKSRGPMNRMGI